MSANSFITAAVRVQCSAMEMPGAEVAIARVVPWVSAPGLGSIVSNWLGPPAIQSRMQDLPCLRSSGAAAAMLEKPATPQAARKLLLLSKPCALTRTAFQVESMGQDLRA